MGQLMYEATKHAWSVMPKAAELIGEPTADERATWVHSTAVLAEQHGVEAEYTELAGELIGVGAPDVPARLAAFWAVRRYFGRDARIASELDGPLAWEIELLKHAAEADREEAETQRFYREDFPAIAAARGQRVEDSPAWRIYGGAVGEGPSVVASTFGVERTFELHELPKLRQVDWPAERIRDEYRRWWSTAERRFWDGEYAAAKPHAADELEAARFATRRVLDRRIETGSRPAVAPRQEAVR